MSIYYLISNLLSYVFTTIIYLFIFCIIVLIYKDIKRMGKEDYSENEKNEEDFEDRTAILKYIKTRESSKFGIKSKYRIGVGPIFIGRDSNCDISIPDLYLSLKHLKIFCKSGVWYIQDLKSKNGTFVNDKKIKKIFQLEDNDIISFGDVKFSFHSE